MEKGRVRVAIQTYRDLEVWKEGMELAKSCYFVTRKFPREELFGLTSQVRRAAASVPANIAEGHGRETTGEFIHFLRVAQGSLKELETHLILAGEVGNCQPEATQPLLNLADRLGRMLRSLIRALQARKGSQ
jgi:four helix bundle protein